MKKNQNKIFQTIMRILHSDKSVTTPFPRGGGRVGVRGCLFGLLLLLFSSCEKEIDMDYHTVEPLYVVEASISEEGAVARISQTQNVTDEIGKRPVSDAQVIISSNYGEQCILNLDSAGCYSSSEIKGVEGREYTIRVQVGNYITKSTSRMQEKFSIDDTYMYKEQMLEDEVVYYHVDVTGYKTDSIGYFYALVTRNGEPYKWAVTGNKGHGDTTAINVGCFVYCDLDKDNKDILKDGEEIAVEVRKIDKRTYDYLYALHIAERSASNPIRNFTNPSTLGYFSAYHSTRQIPLRFAKESLEFYDDLMESKK
jgi:hypothetical protein